MLTLFNTRKSSWGNGEQVRVPFFRLFLAVITRRRVLKSRKSYQNFRRLGIKHSNFGRTHRIYVKEGEKGG